MKPYLVAPEAEDDLRQIWRYLLSEAGLAIANRIQGELAMLPISEMLREDRGVSEVLSKIGWEGE